MLHRIVRSGWSWLIVGIDVVKWRKTKAMLVLKSNQWRSNFRILWRLYDWLVNHGACVWWMKWNGEAGVCVSNSVHRVGDVCAGDLILNVFYFRLRKDGASGVCTSKDCEPARGHILKTFSSGIQTFTNTFLLSNFFVFVSSLLLSSYPLSVQYISYHSAVYY